MKLQETINKYFSKENIINSICRYQLYYQIGLSGVVFQSTKDKEEAHKKLVDLNLQIDTNKVFESIQKAIFYLSQEDDFEDKFINHLKFTALAQMLDDFIESNQEFIDAKTFADIIFDKIQNNTFFDKNMQEQFEEDYDMVYEAWQVTITDEIAQNIKSVASEIPNDKEQA